MTTYLIFGASRGLGDAFNTGLPEHGDTLWLVSRSKPRHLENTTGIIRHWLSLDLSQPTQAAHQLSESLAGVALDVVIYNAGIWEGSAFDESYDFAAISPAETEAVLTVNLTSAIYGLQALLPNLRRASQAKVILIGSISGVENAGFPEVAYVASKFGLRGVAHALREYFRSEAINVTCLNPGSFATDLPYEAGREAVLQRHAGALIPTHDIVALVKCLQSLSPATCVKEIDLPARSDADI